MFKNYIQHLYSMQYTYKQSYVLVSCSYAPLRRRGVYCFAQACRYVGPSVGRPKLAQVITQQFLDVWSSNLTWRLVLTSRWPLLILGLIGSKVKVTVTLKSKIILKLVLVITQQCLDLWSSNLIWKLGLTSRLPLLFLGIIGPKVKVTVTLDGKRLSEW